MKKSDYCAAIFDVDGTLLDTTEGIVSAVQYTIKQYGLSELSYKEYLSFIGPPIQNSFRIHYGIEDKIELQKIATIFRDRYKVYDLLKAKSYDGIYRLCDSLMKNNIKIAVATYKRQDYAIEILQHFGFHKYSDILIGADHDNKLTKADIIRKCIEELGFISTKDIVMIGDSDNDAEGAEKMGVDFIGVTYGFGFKSSADVMKYRTAVGCVNSPIDLLSFFGMETERNESKNSTVCS